MEQGRAEFLKELLADFRVEAAEHRQAVVDGLLALEQEPPPERCTELWEAIGREVHSLKGAARAVNLRPIESLCQAFENLVASIRQATVTVTAACFDTLHAGMDVLDQALAELAQGETAVKAAGLTDVLDSIQALRAGQPVAREAVRPDSPPAAPAVLVADSKVPPVPESARVEEIGAGRGDSAFAETVRISTTRLGALLRQAEELVAVKSVLGYYVAELKEVESRHVARRRLPDRGSSALTDPERPNGADPDDVIRDIAAIASRMDGDHRLLGRMVDDLLLDMKKTLLSPFSSLLGLLPKVARDLARDRGKEVTVSVRGGEIEVDRRILEEIKDPLIHVIRNCVDHGIEAPDERLRRGKPARGRITVTGTTVEGREVLLEVTDDGAGIDVDQTRAAAVRQGLLTHDEATHLAPDEVLRLVFASGISTSAFVTDLSGRGLGMAIVEEKVSQLGGSVAIASLPGAGTTVTFRLPLTLATFRGVAVGLGEHLLVVPTLNVQRAIRIRATDLKTVEGQPTIQVDGRTVPVLELGDVLSLDTAGSPDEVAGPRPALILAAGQTRIAFLVDQVMGEQEGLVKELGPQLPHVRHVAGATVLGSGRVVPIVNVGELMETAVSGGRRPAAEVVDEPRAVTAEDEPERPSLLVAEDSVTARSLLRNILESAGYQVQTAVDGLDALMRLRSDTFDLLVSDVQMPNLDGFELTERLRAEERTADLPVVLVTALDSPEDRKRGMQAGANAYIVKGSFEQSNLLEVIQRLL